MMFASISELAVTCPAVTAGGRALGMLGHADGQAAAFAIIWITSGASCMRMPRSFSSWLRGS